MKRRPAYHCSGATGERRYLYGMRKLLCLLPSLFLAACAVAPPVCAPSGQWISPGLQMIADPVLRAAAHPIVLLGEAHDNAADHRWQLATIERLYAANPTLVLGFEMFPRAAQPVLDRWVQGGLSEPDFLAQTDWKHVWGFDAGLYLPIFRFARDRRIPMLALNVSERVVHMVAKRGWNGVAVADREGVGTPAPPSASYQARLAEAMSGHGGMSMTPGMLGHFIDAQLVWDRAMAEAITTQRTREPQRPVVALMGVGHLENRDGVPHQLDALHVADAVVLLPAHQACTPFGRSYADAIYAE